MQKVKEFLQQAEEQKIVGSAEIRALLNFADKQYEAGYIKQDSLFSKLSAPVDLEDQFVAEPSEAPRLVRGFHDVLISIGITVFLAAVWGILGSITVIIFVIALSEYFIKRQKLALPAFLLTSFLAVSSYVLFIKVFGSNVIKDISPALILASLFFVLSGYYWRYRVPIALASLIVAALSTFFAIVLIMLGVSIDGNVGVFINQNPRIVGFVGLCFSVVAFLIAMYFDVQDTKRVTRRSDVAFWMHLGLAPLLMYSLFFTILGDDGVLWRKGADQLDALVVLMVISFMILVGIIIDRRAFVTSGLISLGVAVYILTEGIGLSSGFLFHATMLALGIIILSIGAGWNYARRNIVSRLPEMIKNKVPAIAEVRGV